MYSNLEIWELRVSEGLVQRLHAFVHLRLDVESLKNQLKHTLGA